jgi:UDP:flavonoid glycosyltransferase YjiC (YdhE family)
MAKIALVPVPEFGHVNPTFKLARSLLRRGHEVYYLSLADLEKYIRCQGFEFISIFGQACPKGSLYKDAPQGAGNIYRMLLQIGHIDAGDVLNEVKEAVQQSKADLLLIDILLRDLSVVGRELGIGCALHSVTITDGYLGLSPSDHDFADDLPVLVLCPQELDFPHSDRQKGHYYIEACIELERTDLSRFPWDRVVADRRLIYCTLGSHSHQYSQSPSFFRTVIEAMRGRPEWQLVLAIGARLNVADFQSVPDNVVIVNWAPQLEILKRASLMISNAALGSIKDCIFFGVPMILFPVMWEQPDNAARVVHHGLGVRGNINTVSAEQIRNLIDRLDNPTIKRRIASMSKKFRQIENSGIGVRVVERILEGVRARTS